MTLSAVALGDLPEWIAAIGTAGAFVGGVIVLRPQLKQMKDAALDERRSQAVLIYAWVDAVNMTSSGTQVVVRVRNTSLQPVYDCSVAVEGASSALRYGDVPPGLDPTRDGLLANSATNRDRETLPIVLEFTDTHGIRWKRQMQKHGELNEVS